MYNKDLDTTCCHKCSHIQFIEAEDNLQQSVTIPQEDKGRRDWMCSTQYIKLEVTVTKEMIPPLPLPELISARWLYRK